MFMCFGFVILVSYHSQDNRLVSLNNLNPLLKRLYYFSSLCLIVLPFLRGFFSKDFIIEKIIEFNREFFLIFLLIVFLRVRVFYGVKLMTLTNVFYSYTIIEKNYLGIFGVVVIIVIITRVINLYVSLILSLRLEILSFKIVIYFFILIFLMIRVLININFKFNVYDKIKRFN